MSPLGWAALLLAAGIGAPMRYVLDRWVQGRTRGAFPWGTLTVNVTGCFALGLIAGLGLHHGLGPVPRAILGTGGLGAYTTFSTFTVETVRIGEEGATHHAAVNAVANLLAGLAAVVAGLGLTAL